MSRWILAMIGLVPALAAAAPLSVAHQGRLLDSAGAPYQGTHTVGFALFGAESGGSARWSQEHSLALQDGYFSAVLTGIEQDDLVGGAFLETSVDGAALAPRTPLASVPFALRAAVAESVAGGPVDATRVSVGAIPSIDPDGQLTAGPPTTCDVDHQGALAYDPADASLRICHGTAWFAVWSPVGLGTSPSTAATSCLAIKQTLPAAASGLYWIDPQQDGGAYEVLCDMVTGGGGWTFIANISDAGSDVWSQLNPAQDTGLWQSTDTLGAAPTHTADYKSQAYLDLVVTDLLITHDGDKPVLRADDCWNPATFRAFMSGLSWAATGSDSNWADSSGAHRCSYTHFNYNDPVLRASGSSELGFKWGEANGVQDGNKDRVMITTANANGAAHHVDNPTGLGGFTALGAALHSEDVNECQGDSPNVCTNGTQNYGLWVR
jgi:hypothetical protein